jgi:hypothetical protein
MEERKSSKGIIIVILAAVILCLAGYIVYDKVLSKKLAPATPSTPLNETFETSEECADETDEMLLGSMSFKPASKITVDKSNLIKSSYPLHQAYYCYDMGCQEKEMTAKELEEYRNETDGYGLILKVTISNGVATIYDYGETGKLQKTQKLDVQGVKGVNATFNCGGDAPYGIIVLDKNNDLYLYKYIDASRTSDFGYDKDGNFVDKEETKEELTNVFKKLLYKNVKDFDFDFDIYEKGILLDFTGCRWAAIALHTLDGKSFVYDINDGKAISLNKVSQLTTTVDISMGLDGVAIYVDNNREEAYQKYNGEDIKIKGLFVKNPTESKDEEEINYDAIIHLVTENDEHLYYRFDDCEHKYRLYTNGKVKSLTYDTKRKKAIMTYTDGNKVEFDYDNKIELK